MPRCCVERHLVGADIEAAIDRRRVAIDDLAAIALRQREAERALAGGGWPEDGDEELGGNAIEV